MVEGAIVESYVENGVDSSIEGANLLPTNSRVYKYAPRYGYDASNEDMVIVLTHKLEPRKHGS